MQWWRDFYSFYILDVKRFHIKHPTPVWLIKKGMVVLMQVDKAKRIDWKMGKVDEVVYGVDGLPRSANI